MLLLDLTSTPTAAGHEWRVIGKIERWVRDRPHLVMERDDAGNLTIKRRDETGDRPTYFTAHLDHPAFVVERVEEGIVHLSFRGGVRDLYFLGSMVRIHCADGEPAHATVTEAGKADPYRSVRAQLDHPSSGLRISGGETATWALEDAEVDGEFVRAPVCDDLAAVSAA